MGCFHRTYNRIWTCIICFIYFCTLAWLLGIVLQFLTITQMRKLPFRQDMAGPINADTLSLVVSEIGLFGCMGFVALVLISNLYPILQFSVCGADRHDFRFLHKLHCKLVVSTKWHSGCDFLQFYWVATVIK